MKCWNKDVYLFFFFKYFKDCKIIFGTNRYHHCQLYHVLFLFHVESIVSYDLWPKQSILWDYKLLQTGGRGGSGCPTHTLCGLLSIPGRVRIFVLSEVKLGMYTTWRLFWRSSLNSLAFIILPADTRKWYHAVKIVLVINYSWIFVASHISVLFLGYLLQF